MSGDALRAWNKRHGFLALEFEDMSRDALKAWNKEHGLPTSHNRKILIQQARTRIGVKVTPRGRRRNRNFNLEGTAEENPKSNMPELEGTSAETAVELESDVDITEHTFEDPEDSRYRDDANEPGTGSYFYDSAS